MNTEKKDYQKYSLEKLSEISKNRLERQQKNLKFHQKYYFDCIEKKNNLIEKDFLLLSHLQML